MAFAKIDNNLDMFYDIDDFTDPWKKPETVVLQHGNAKNSRFWYGWVPLLARHYRVVNLDARGFGQSSKPAPGYKFSLSGFARDLKLLLDFLCLDKVHLIGETAGGTIGMQFAHDYPERLLTLTVCGSPFRFPDHGDSAVRVAQEGMLSWARETNFRRFDPNVDPAFAEWYTNEMAKASQQVVVAVFEALAGNDLSDVSRQIKAPTLLLYPEAYFRSAGYPREMQRLIPNSELVLLEGITGVVQHSHPEKCVEVVLPFLKRHSDV
ncbi:MAG: alpha/beta hydrolase [Chloroflexi bacterium]|nr:alpha/beta hydrolase [Chloroflexota bacterium]